MSEPKTSAGGTDSETDDPKRDVIEDAVVLDDPSDDPAEGSTEGDEAPQPDAPEVDDAVADEGAEDGAVADPAPETPADVPEKAPVEAAAPKRGFVPVFLGGVAAAALGAGVALFLFPNGIGGQDDTVQQQILADLAAQTEAVAALEAKLANLSLPPDLTAEVAALNAPMAAQAQQLATHETRIEMLSALIGDLEKRPIADNLAPEAIAAYERELKALQTAMAQQRAEVEEKLAESAALRATAEVDAQTAAARDALSLLTQAVDGGLPLGSALAALEGAGVTVPEALNSLQAGVPTLAALQISFPDAARAALAADNSANGGSGVTNFLRHQLGVRSLTPQEGDSADAILSRAEAALTAADLSTAMAELSSLPEAAAGAIAPWLGDAAKRADALTALDALRQSVMTN